MQTAESEMRKWVEIRRGDQLPLHLLVCLLHGRLDPLHVQEALALLRVPVEGARGARRSVVARRGHQGYRVRRLAEALRVQSAALRQAVALQRRPDPGDGQGRGAPHGVPRGVPGDRQRDDGEVLDRLSGARVEMQRRSCAVLRQVSETRDTPADESGRKEAATAAHSSATAKMFLRLASDAALLVAIAIGIAMFGLEGWRLVRVQNCKCCVCFYLLYTAARMGVGYCNIHYH